jgi:ubiquinone/menaquinone biosynthesis C-methylase UbiE
MDNLDELKYREKIQPHEQRFNHPQKWIRNMRKEKLKIPLFLKKEGVEWGGCILEIGAGSCWFSSVLSKFPEVKEIYALDFSEHILKSVAPAMMDYLNANAGKIVRVRGSFYNLISLGKQFDFVVCDQTFHHADYPIELLNQINKVLKRDGRVVCLREPIAPKLPILRSISQKIFGAKERKYGVTENIYTLSEWREIFVKGGFDVVVYPLRLPSKKILVNALSHSSSILSRACNAIYGIGSIPAVFVGKKHAKG